MADIKITGQGSLLDGNTGHGNRQSSESLGITKSAADVGRRATGGDPNQAIIGAETTFLQIRPTGVLQILKAFRAAQQSGGATRQHGLHKLRIAAEGRGAFRSIENTQSTRGAGPEIKQPPASAKTVDNAVHRVGKNRGCSGNGLLRPSVLLHKKVHQRGRIELIQL